MSKICHTIHQWFNGMKKHFFHQLYHAMKRHSLPQWFSEQGIPENGIYILFEKGELAHSTDRIVRIGTHTGENKLRYRLKEHLNENKDRSIFRKNIGRAFLNKYKDDYLKIWDIDFKKIKNQEKYGYLKDMQKEDEIEKRVTKYIRDNISFVTFQIDNKDKRFEFESKIISTVSLCCKCKPSQNWLGLSFPKEKIRKSELWKIRKSGLWLVNELWKTPLSEDDLIELKNTLENAGHST